MRGKIISGLMAVSILFAAAATQAEIGDQIYKLIPDNGGAGSRFGRSVDIDGTIAIVGANNDQENGFGTGAAYIIDTTTGLRLVKLLPNDSDIYDEFGVSVGLSGKRAVVGAWRDDDNGESSGSAYIFDSTTGQQLFKLLPDDGAAEDEFGRAVAIYGTTAIVSARRDDERGQYSGSAYLFDTETGKQLFKLLPSSYTPGQEFGYDVAIFGQTAIVGAWRDDDAGPRSGSVYLFDTVTGQEIRKLTPSDGDHDQLFGTSVEICESYAIVGAKGDIGNGVSSGAAYVFDAATGVQLAKLITPGISRRDRFGEAVAINETTAMVSAKINAEGVGSFGAAYLFTRSSGFQINLIAKLTPNNAEPNEGFGVSIAISDDTALVGSYYDNAIFDQSGSAYVFESAEDLFPSDINNDGIVDTADLSILLGQFGLMGP